MCDAGDCFLIDTDYYEDGTVRSHLFVIVLKPVPHTKNTIIVSTNTARGRGYDTTTIIEPGAHDFINKRSYVVCRRAMIVSVEDIENHVVEGRAKPMAPMPIDVFKRICDGILRSPFTLPEIKSMYSDSIFESL